MQKLGDKLGDEARDAERLTAILADASREAEEARGRLEARRADLATLCQEQANHVEQLQDFLQNQEQQDTHTGAEDADGAARHVQDTGDATEPGSGAGDSSGASLSPGASLSSAAGAAAGAALRPSTMDSGAWGALRDDRNPDQGGDHGEDTSADQAMYQGADEEAGYGMGFEGTDQHGYDTHGAAGYDGGDGVMPCDAHGGMNL